MHYCRRSGSYREVGDGTGEGVREGNGEPYGALRYRGVSSMGEKGVSIFSGVRGAEAIAGEDNLLSNCPSIGASDSTGDPGKGVPALLPVALLTTFTNRTGSLPAG